ncbi:TPA: hypothetical protein QHX37_003479 [Morganella morganii subsp. morganii]|nr:hypothetical protein [Morganella morganii subsp. morganii]
MTNITTLIKLTFISICSMLLSACNGLSHQYSTYDTLAGIIAPTGQYSEWHTNSDNYSSGNSDTQTSRNCIESEAREHHANGITTVRQSNCNGRSQTQSNSRSHSRSSSVGFSVKGPVGASLGLIDQIKDMNKSHNNDVIGKDMFNEFGF